jgi:hypothetical protein
MGGLGFSSVLSVLSGTRNFSPPITNDIHLLKVEQIFSGINYLEELSKVNSVGELVTTMSGTSAASTGGSVHSADTDSIFNKFSIFKYSKFINGVVYQPQAHFIGYMPGTNTDPNDPTARLNTDSNKEIATGIVNQDQLLKNFNVDSPEHKDLTASIANNLALLDVRRSSAENYLIKNASALANPTASNIIKWASTQSMDSVTGFQPYAMTDFMFCKNYGLIPNNRLITIRRYPFPIDDLLRTPGEKNPIPIAQAVTWFGEGTENVLSNIGVMNWGLRWDSNSLKIDDYQTIEGNEVTVDDLLVVFDKVPGLEDLSKKIRTIYTGLNGNDAQLQQITKMEGKLQDYSRALYTSNGPYWNRIYGPVNVINATTRRARGMQDGWNTQFTINFHYQFRSFNGLSPKMVALDLIASFLNLTYNDAQFLGQLARYFPRLGLKFSPTITQMLGDLLTKWGTSFTNGSIIEVTKLSQELMQGIKTAASQGYQIGKDLFSGETQKLTGAVAKLFKAGSASLLADAIPKLISVKSALSDRPVGEWHLVIGNPMNPILTMGDLVCSNCILKFDEEMGPDDFPTGCTFSIKLAQGKPRDKASIERMFNLGESKLMYSKMRAPSSANDTFGETNNTAWSAITKDLSESEKADVLSQLGNDTFDKYQGRIRRSYGYTYAAGKSQASGLDTKTMDDSMLWLYFDRGQEKS